MRRQSPKLAARLRIYRPLRNEFLAEHPTCEWCGRGPTELHHRRGRVGALLLAVEHWSALCHEDHAWATEHPAWAYDRNLSEHRVGVTTEQAPK